MFRVVLYLLASVLLISVLRAVIGAILKAFADLFHPASPAASGPPRPSVTPGGELKKDPVCGTFISAATNFQKKAGGATYYFCSAECMAKFKS
jgi:YHS domain-containing protein